MSTTEVTELTHLPHEPLPNALLDEWDVHFVLMHNALAQVGMCDTTGGVECHRVYEDAKRAGKPEGPALAAFIRVRANIGPRPCPPEDVPDAVRHHVRPVEVWLRQAFTIDH